MFRNIVFGTCGIFITLYLANFVTGDPVFTSTEKNFTADVGKDVVIEWEYTVSDRSTIFENFSPVWNYYDSSGADFELASEVKSQAWKWVISTASCPKRLLNPVQRLHKEGNASLKIQNVSLDDRGIYECQLKVKFKPAVIQRMYLNVKEPVPTTTAVPPTNTTATGSNSSTSTTSSSTIGSTTENGKDGDSDALSDGAIAGISVAVIVVVVVIVVLAVCMWKKSKNNGSNGSNNKSGPLEMDKPPGDGNTTSPEA